MRLVSLKLYILTVLCCFFSLSAKEYITAVVGQNVTLPCKVPNNNKTIRAVEWSRPGLDPEYVLLYRDERLDVDNQHPSYQNWVDLQDKEMKDGDISLVLKNVTMEDNGRYECYVLQGETTSKTVYLEVYPSGKKNENIGVGVNKVGGNKDGADKDGIIVGAAVGVILLLAVALVAFLIYRRHMKKNPNLPVPPDEAAAEQML